MLSLGLNRLEKEEEIQRYQFRRLISAANNVHLVYEENQEKEKNRFIEEIIWGKQKEQKKLEVIEVPKASYLLKVSGRARCIKKSKEIVKYLRTQTYSASRINTYVRCPMEFYYHYVLGLKEKEDLLQDPHAASIGTFIHELLEVTFASFLNRKPVLDDSFKRYFFKTMDEKFDVEIAQRMKSDALLIKKIITDRLQKFLENETKRAVRRLICVEQTRRGVILLNGNQIEFEYTVDRIDELEDGSLLVIDYKTGTSNLIPKRCSYLERMEMTRESIKNDIKSFQLPLYYYFVSQSFPESDVNAELYNIRTLQRNPFIAEKEAIHKDKIVKLCIGALESIFEELFNCDIPFEADRGDRCRFCPFTGLCT
jgi:ATP-dependent helicase/DNAse subunit B